MADDSRPARISAAIIVLRPSRIEGIGCFTLHAIRSGERVANLWDDADVHFVPAGAVPPGMLAMHKRYCVESPGGFWCPLDFKRMSVGWYLNHSDDPNLGSLDGGHSYVALRDIPADAELTIDYRKLDDDVDNLG